jgi:hypothetical protein
LQVVQQGEFCSCEESRCWQLLNCTADVQQRNSFIFYKNCMGDLETAGIFF